MKSKTLFIFAFLVAVFGCNRDSTEPTTQPTPQVEKPVEVFPFEVSLTKLDDGYTVNIANEGIVNVSLVEDPTKNLKWVCDYNIGFIKIDEFKKTPQPDKETRTFVFKADKTISRNGLTFSYGPFGHERTQPVEKVTFNFEIQ